MRTGWSVDNLSGMQSFGVKLVLLGGVVGWLFVTGLLTDSFQATEEWHQERRQERSSVQAVHVVPVDINYGSSEELQTLPGIGAVLAERIVRYRSEHGNFMSTADVKQVRGIGTKRFEQLRPYVRAGQSEGDSNG